MSYPVMLSLKGKKCLIAGAGRVAERKAKMLAGEGARVYVVSPEFRPYFKTRKNVKLIRRKFRPQDLEGKFLVIAATNDKKANSSICRLASKRNMLANNAGARQNANFMNMAFFERKGCLVAMSSHGIKPKKSRLLSEKTSKIL